MFLSSLNIVDRFGPSPTVFSSNLLLIIGLQHPVIIIIIIIVTTSSLTNVSCRLLVMWLGRRTCDQQVASSTPAVHCRVSTWMGDRLRERKKSGYVTGHLGQLSLPSLRVGKSNTGLCAWGKDGVCSFVG